MEKPIFWWVFLGHFPPEQQMSRVIHTRKTLTNYGAANVARMTASCLSQLRARWQGGGRENILYDRRLASQISHDRCSITIEQRGEKKIQSTHPFSLPTGCSLYIRQPTLLPFFYTGNKENLQTIVWAAALTRGAGNNESDPFTFGTESRARN